MKYVNVYLYIYIHNYMYTYIYIERDIYDYICIYIHTYTYFYVYINTYTHIYVYTYIYRYIYMYICRRLQMWHRHCNILPHTATRHNTPPSAGAASCATRSEID